MKEDSRFVDWKVLVDRRRTLFGRCHLYHFLYSPMKECRVSLLDRSGFYSTCTWRKDEVTGSSLRILPLPSKFE